MGSNNNKVRGNVFMLKQDKTKYVIYMYFVINLFYKAAFTLIYFINCFFISLCLNFTFDNI